MLKIRLKRVGKRNDPSYRIVVVDSRQSTKSGRYIEMLGSYDPKIDKKTVDAERAQYWIGQGAQTSGTVHNLLVDAGAINAGKINALPRKQVLQKEEDTTEAAESTEASPEEGEGGSDSEASAEGGEETSEESGSEESGEEKKEESSDDKSGEEQEAEAQKEEGGSEETEEKQ